MRANAPAAPLWSAIWEHNSPNRTRLAWLGSSSTMRLTILSDSCFRPSLVTSANAASYVSSASFLLDCSTSCAKRIFCSQVGFTNLASRL